MSRQYNELSGQWSIRGRFMEPRTALDLIRDKVAAALADDNPDHRRVVLADIGELADLGLAAPTRKRANAHRT